MNNTQIELKIQYTTKTDNCYLNTGKQINQEGVVALFNAVISVISAQRNMFLGFAVISLTALEQLQILSLF